MMRAGLAALLSHWRRHPLQLAMLLSGLALATALWSGVQAINAEARAAYAQAAGTLGQDRLARLVGKDGEDLEQSLYVALRRQGWAVSPVIDSVMPGTRLHVLGIEPLTLPSEADLPGTPRLASGDLAAFLAGRLAYAHPDTLARPGVAEQLPGLRLTPTQDLPPMTVLADIGAAQRLLRLDGRVTALLVDPDHPLPGPLPDGLVLRQPTVDDGLARLTDSFHLNLSAFGFLAFAVGVFIVHSAIGLAFEQRRPVFATLRALGLPARALTLLLLAELLILSLVAGIIGVALGYVVAAALLPDVAATLGGLYGAPVPGSLSLRAEWWGAGLAIAVIGTLVAAAQSLWQIWHLPVLAPARPRGWALASARAGRWQFAAGAALLALAAMTVGLGSGLLAGFAVLAGLLLGAALILPALLTALTSLASRLSTGVLAQWFWADTRQQLPGLSLALMALLLALATNVGVGTMVTSFRSTFTGWLDQRLASELYLTTRSAAEAAEITAWLQPQVDAILPIVTTEATLMDQPGDIYGVADHATYRDNWPLLEAAPAVWDSIARGEAALINEQLARRAGLALGDSLPLPGGALPVAGIYSDYGNPSPQAIIGLGLFTTRFPDVPPLRFALRLPAEKVSALADAVQSRFVLPEGALIDQAGIKAYSLQVFDRTFTVTAALNALTLGVAGLAMFASLMTLAGIRLPQLAPVWAMGLTQRHLAALDFLRTLLLALLTAVVALPLGLALAWVLLAVVNVEAFGWRLPMQVHPTDWLRMFGTATVAACLAAVLPTLHLARRAPTDLLRVFANER
jgi:putative ABC transport system permease protein